jgi:hypothetical protein
MSPHRAFPRYLPAFLSLALVLVRAGPAWAAEPERVSYALIIANNASLDPKQASLRYADDDGARYYELFLHLHRPWAARGRG